MLECAGEAACSLTPLSASMIHCAHLARDVSTYLALRIGADVFKKLTAISVADGAT